MESTTLETTPDLQTQLTPYFLKLDEFYLKYQLEKGDKFTTEIKLKFNISYSQLNTLYKLHKIKVQGEIRPSFKNK